MSKNYFAPLLPFVLGWGLLLLIRDYFAISLVNGVLQLVLFAFVVCLPAWKTGRMSYVDIGWPTGLAVIGVLLFVMGDGALSRRIVVSGAYLFMGLRMSTLAIVMWRRGHLEKELPRYQYQRGRWDRSGKTNHMLAMQVEALVQGVANASFLAVPGFIIAFNTNPDYAFLELVGLVIWVGAYIMESVADRQKMAFLLDMKAKGLSKQVCNVGLWRYSRHPNYFAEWMVWNGLIVAALPSWWALSGEMNILLWALLGFALVNVSRVMYTTLVYYTGAVPAEFYSKQKRPGYEAYQQTTNMFFPGPPKK